MSEMTVRDVLTDAIRYWEVRRIAYNAILAAVVVAAYAFYVMPASWMPSSIIIASVCVMMFLINGEWWREQPSWLRRYIRWFFYLATVMVAIYVFSVMAISWLPDSIIKPWEKYFHPNWHSVQAGTSHFINFLTIAGLAVTSVGILLTYKQMREN